MIFLNKIWDAIASNGISKSASLYDQKKRLLFNVLWFIALIAYIIFFITLCLLKGNPAANKWLTSLLVFSGFSLAGLLMHKNRFTAARVVFLISVYGGIFFYNDYLGTGAGVYFYYFTFLTASVSLFSWKEGKAWLVGLTLLPVLLLWLSHLNRQPAPLLPGGSDPLYFFNCCLSILLLAVYSFYITSTSNNAEKKAQEASANMQVLLDNTTAIIWSIDKMYNLVSYNKGFAEVAKDYYNVEVTEGFNLQHQLFSLPQYPGGLKEIYKMVLSGEKYSGEYFSNNNYYEILARPLLNEQQQITGATFYSRNISEKKKKEKEIQQMSLNLQTLIDNIQGAIWSVDASYRVIAVNRSFSNSMKRFFNVDFVVGFNVMELHESDAFPDSFRKNHLKVFGGETLFDEYEFQGNYYEIQGEPLRSSLGEIIGATFYNVNITQRKKNQQELQQASLNLQTLINTTENSIWSVDTSYKIIAASRVYVEDMKRIFGVTVEPGFNVQQLFSHAAYPAEWQGQYKHIFAGNNLFETYTFEDRYYEISGRPLLNSRREVIGAAFYARDITEKHTSAQKLQQSEINLQTLIDNNYGSTWCISAGYTLLACNKKYKADIKAVFGIDIQPGYNVKELFDHPMYTQAWIDYYSRVTAGESFNEIYEARGRVYELTAVPVKNAKGELSGAAFHLDDITEARKNEMELIAAKEKAEEASNAKARFLSNMSHELRTPLNGVIGITNILLGETYLDSQKQSFEVLKYSSDHMLSLINDILDYNKIEEGKVVFDHSPFNLAGFIDKTATLFGAQAKEKQLELVVKKDSMLNREVLGDTTRLTQVLNNLLANAIKFTDNGTVTLEAAIEQKLSDKECLIRFSVTDTGIGIDESKLNKIFDSFTQADADTTRKYGGTGLGLTISRRLIELMGGQLKVESVAGKGSKFSFSLIFQCRQEQALKPPAKQMQHLDPFDNLRVLLAEDNTINRMVAKKILEKWNIEVHQAENGEAALRQMELHQFDLVLMDMEMPVMDGLTAVAHIRKTNSTIPIIALTAASFDDMQNFLRNNGLNDYVQKPFTPEELNQKIRKLAADGAGIYKPC
jgi:signal transduction histidine kinase/CheY-like chemotaxis protein